MILRCALLLLVCLLAPARPSAAAAHLCLEAARRAAAEAGVPADLMVAITLAETGRSRGGRMEPWPWTANLDGAGHWFDSRAALRAFVGRALAEGRTSLDIGCFQINWRWHGRHFATPDDLAEPLTAARHAARWLAALRAELGSWEAASGAYHSRRPERAARYAVRVAALRADPAAQAAPAAGPPRPPAAPAGALAASPPRRAGGGWTMPAGPAGAAGRAAAPASLVALPGPARPFLPLPAPPTVRP